MDRARSKFKNKLVPAVQGDSNDMLHAIISQDWPKWALYGQLFVTVSNPGNPTSYLKPNSCVESYRDSFDTHHDHFASTDPKIP